MDYIKRLEGIREGAQRDFDTIPDLYPQYKDDHRRELQDKERTRVREGWLKELASVEVDLQRQEKELSETAFSKQYPDATSPAGLSRKESELQMQSAVQAATIPELRWSVEELKTAARLKRYDYASTYTRLMLQREPTTPEEAQAKHTFQQAAKEYYSEIGVSELQNQLQELTGVKQHLALLRAEVKHGIGTKPANFFEYENALRDAGLTIR